MPLYPYKTTFSPTDLVRFFESKFASYMDHFEKTVSKEICKKIGVYRDPPDPLRDFIINMGNQHEENIINKINEKESVIQIKKNLKNKETAIEKTLLAMRKGEEKIYQGAIKKDIIFGYVDLLVKQKGPSLLGHHYYIPYDFKLSRYPKPSALIQLCCYCDILESIQGILPPQFVVVTKEETPYFFNTHSFFYFYQFLKKTFLHFHSTFSENFIPIPEKTAEHREWSLFARKRLYELDDISLVAGIRPTHCTLLRKKGINKMSKLKKSQLKYVKGIPEVILKALKDQATIQCKSKNTVEYKILPHNGERKGLEILPPFHRADVFFDMEGYPLFGTDGLEYLYGNALSEELKYICFWATRKEEEKNTFEKWLEWIYQRWQENPGMHIYHYGHYEVSTIKKLMGKYGTGESKIDNLLRNSVFVDLYRVVTQALRIGIFSYSIKEVEQLYYNKRTTEVKTSGQAALQFFHFLNSNDTIEHSPFLKRIKHYNKDDCFSIKGLCRFLWSLQKKHDITYIFSKEKNQNKHQQPSPRVNCERKAQTLLSQVPLQKRSLPLSQMEKQKDIYITRLLAHLLEFHIREDKPDWWDYFSRQEMNTEQMLEDKYCIASCRWIDSSGITHKIKFEREQDFTFKIKDKVIILEDDSIWNTYVISDLNLIEGFLWLVQKKQNNIPQHKTFTLVPEKKDFYKNNIYHSLLKTANNFSPTAPFMGLKKCIYDLLLRKHPHLLHHTGPLITKKENLIKETSAHIYNLQNSVFCIQGPPGTGKTYTAAHIILDLIKKGKKIGVTANSHRAILNLLKTVHEQNKKNTPFLCQKVGGDLEDQKILEATAIEFTHSQAVNRKASLIGGTTFFFSKLEEEQTYDYLFVDEASQVSLTNIVAAARAANNIVLIGDQNQLDQPIQANHPGESGHSVLTYYTAGNITISKDKGVFLPVSYRMHPKICEFISDQFYNGKLTYHPTTAKQKVFLPDTLEKLPESGLHFIPVEHSGNVHASTEEAEVISHLYKELLRAKWKTQTGEIQPITMQDILIVAPYNLQVACLELAIPKARIASVDKFQGQEAPVCILSLGSSTIQDAPRGISFLLNKNRLNVALSRARCLSIIVGSKTLIDTNISSIPNMELMNIWCKIVSMAKTF